MDVLFQDRLREYSVVERAEVQSISIATGMRLVEFSSPVAVLHFLRGLRSEPSARASLERLATGLPLRASARAAGADSLERLAHRINSGELVMVERLKPAKARPLGEALAVTPRQAQEAQPVRPEPESKPKAQPLPPEETLVPAPAAQAAVLEAAAKDGTPFCET